MLAFGRKLGTNADLWKNGAASHTCSWRRPSLQLHFMIMMRTMTPVKGKKRHNYNISSISMQRTWFCKSLFSTLHIFISTQANKCNLLCPEQDTEHGIRVVIGCGNPRCLFNGGERVKCVWCGTSPKYMLALLSLSSSLNLFLNMFMICRRQLAVSLTGLPPPTRQYAMMWPIMKMSP